MENKKCNTCNINKLFIYFHKDSKNKDGYRNKCKLCLKEKYNVNKKPIKELTIEDVNLILQIKKEKIKLRNKTYRDNNIDKIREEKRIYKKERINSNPLIKLRYRISNNISVSFKRNNSKKSNKTTNILGCSFENFKIHIESLWEPWMNWDNYGNPKDGIYEPNKTWDLDHKIASSSALTELDILKLNHYTNFQPLCSHYNRFIKKGGQ